jgi:hypothetical protein
MLILTLALPYASSRRTMCANDDGDTTTLPLRGRVFESGRLRGTEAVCGLVLLALALLPLSVLPL